METSTLMVAGPPAQQPPQGPANASANVPAAMQLAALPVPMNLPSDMMSRFEALSRVFRAEVEGLVDEEKEASRETEEQLHVRIADLEEEVMAQASEARSGAARIRTYLGEHKCTWLEHVFGDLEPPEAPEVTVAGFRDVVEAFVQMCEAHRDPEVEAAFAENSNLRQQVTARDAALTTLQDDLREARILKSQEERDLVEFRSLREKESELQVAHLQIAQLQSQLEESQSTQKILVARASQSEATLADKSKKIVNLMKQVEQQTEQGHLLSNENNTLRLQLGKDSDYIKVVQPPADPLSYTCRAGALSDDLQRQEQRLREELSMALFKFPGLVAGSENCRGWCEAQISRQCSVYRSFLHLLQDVHQGTPGGLDISFVSKTREVDEAWLQREEEMRGSDAAFHESENGFTKKCEEKRLELTSERDAKITQLMELADRSQTRAEKQLLMQQAKLFGQRMDAQIQRAWDDQRKERDERWAQHSHAKQDSRQKFKDKTMLVQQEAESAASAADRFQDMAKARLAGPEDAWVRNVEKVSTVSTSVLKGQGLLECFKAAGLQAPVLPREGLQFGGIGVVTEAVEELLRVRIVSRKDACKELEDQTLQQLRHCVERFIQSEGLQQQKKMTTLGDDPEKSAEYSHATTIQSLLHARQHRVTADTMRRQFHDFMLVLRLASLAAVSLLPEGLAESFGSRDAKLDLPAPPQELKKEMIISSGVEPICNENQGVDDNACFSDEQVEGQFVYDAIMRRLLERLLTSMHSKHREELLSLKRTHAKEIRQSLQHLCQLEPESIDKSVTMDAEEYKAQLKTKLLADCEYHVCEERRQLSEQVDEEMDLHVRVYQRQIAEEERAVLRDRRKWLTERLVVLQAQGAGCPGDRAVIQHLRSELRACELRFEMRDRELMDCEMQPRESPLEPWIKKTNVRRSSPQPQTKRDAPQSPAQRAPLGSQACSPSPPRSEAPQNRRPSRGPSPKPSNDMTFPIGRPSGGGVANAPDLWGDLAAAGPPPIAFYDDSPRFDSACKRPEAAPPQSLSCVPDQFIATDRVSPGADGAAGFGRKPSPSFGENPEQLKRCPSFGEGADAILGTSLALYDWPFAASDVMCEMGPKPAKEFHRQRSPRNPAASAMPDVLPPLSTRPPLARPLAPEKFHNVGYHPAGVSHGAASLAPTGSGLKSPRLIPQLLPPVT